MIDRYRNYQPRYQPKQKPRKSKKSIFIIFLLVVVFFSGKIMLSKKNENHKKTESASTNTTKAKPIIKADPIATSTWNNLSVAVNDIINQNPGLDISVAVIDIGTNTKANYGIQDNFAGASTTKVLTAATYLHEVEQDNRSLTQKVGDVPARQQIKQMINQSNNDSWAALNQNLTYTKIQAYAQSIGVNSYKPKENTITASDEALLLQLLYKRELLNEEDTTLLLSYMQNTNNEAMIPKVIPTGATIYHKYGQLEDRLHDASIVEFNQRPIVLVIYTKGGASDGSNYGVRVQLIQQLAETVFNTIYAP